MAIKTFPNDYSEKTSLNNNDKFLISDSQAGDKLKYITGNKINLLDGKYFKYSIVPSISSGNLTVALKNYNGDDPTPTAPVYVQIGDTIYTITSALSRTISAGTNYFNAGSSELATKEIDYFIYLTYSISNANMRLGISRISHGKTLEDFGSLSTPSNEKILVMSSGNSSTTDECINIGRFSAILSAGTGYTWSTPSAGFQVLNYQTLKSKWRDCVPSFTWTNMPTSAVSHFIYQVDGPNIRVRGKTYGTANVNPSGQTIILSLPFSIKPINSSGSFSDGYFEQMGCNGHWSDNASFDEGSDWSKSYTGNNLGINFPTATRYPTIFNMNAEYRIG